MFCWVLGGFPPLLSYPIKISIHLWMDGLGTVYLRSNIVLEMTVLIPLRRAKRKRVKRMLSQLLLATS